MTQTSEILNLRKKTNMNQSQFAKLIGIHQQALSRYELGNVHVSLNRFRDWEEAVNNYLTLIK